MRSHIYIYIQKVHLLFWVFHSNFPNNTRGRDEGAVEVVTRMKVPLTPPTTEDEAEEGGMVVAEMHYEGV